MILVPKPHLADLVFDEATHTYTYKGRVEPSVTGIIREAGMSSFGNTDGVTRPMQVGTWIHHMLALHFREKLDEDSLSTPMMGILSSVKEWARKNDVRPLAVEVPLAHPLFRFCGKTDLVGTMKGVSDVVVFDWKWGDARPSDAVQIAGGYAILVSSCYDGLPSKNVRGCPVYLKKLMNGWEPELIAPGKSAEAQATYMSALNVYRWRERHGLLTKEEDGYGTG